MSGFSANTQTLLMLALISNEPQLRDAIKQDPQRKEIVIRSYLNSLLSPLVQDAVYGPIYVRLMAHSIDQTAFHLVDWALRADQAVFFQEDRASREETAVFWDALTQSEHLLSQLKQLSREWEQNVRRGARILRAYFRLHSPMVMRTYECPFLVQALLGMCLSRINWIEIATQLLDVPVPEQVPLKREESEEDDPHVRLAILQEVLELGRHDFDEYAGDLWCSQDVRNVCMELADQCAQAEREVGQLKEQGRVARGIAE